MKIIDPHFHLWDLDELSYPWLTTETSEGVFGDNSSIRKTYKLDDYLSESGKFEIVKSVHIEAAVDAGLDVDETVWLENIAEKGGQPDAIVAYCDLSIDSVVEKLDAQKKNNRVRGIRQILNTHVDERLNFAPQEFMENPRWIEGFEMLGALGLSFDLQIYPAQMTAATRLAQQNAGTSIILNHTGMPTGHDAESLECWRTGMSELAQYENVSVKISGLGMMFHTWTEKMIRPIVLETINLFGSERCMFASNFPVDRMYSSFDVLWSAYCNITSGLSSTERDNLFGQSAERIYRI
ncbi:amidohydrolase family protein [Ahrensia kielensis]|uniref:amidohydrolase family protein n=1 Tax=Ahrensia kielensis TaxID=76980 RepID=UPI000365F03F|nr:amidohydrolase family protein [Ahrensia kielensis]